MQFLQTLCDVECQVDKETVGFILDFIVAEEDVCLKKVDGFIQNVRISKLLGGRATNLGFQRKAGHIPDNFGWLCKLRMVRLQNQEKWSINKKERKPPEMKDFRSIVSQNRNEPTEIRKKRVEN